MPEREKDALSDDALRVEIRGHVARLRGDAGDEERAAIGERLAPLAAHPSAKVRQAVAEACEWLPRSFADPLLDKLLEDEDGYVCRAAKRAQERGVVHRAARARAGEADEEVARLLAQIGAKSKSARALADRAVAREREALSRTLHHELAKVVTALEFSLHRIGSELTRPELDRALLRRDAAVATERLAFLWSTIVSTCVYAGAVTPEFCQESLAQLVDDAHAQLLTRLGPERAARVAFQNEVSEKLALEAHRHSLLQALQNFLQNGAEAYDERASSLPLRVTARALRGGAEILLEVRDEGSGMSDARKERLFRRFESRKPGGTGLGLLIARKMIEEVHGGTLELESAKGAGTTVRVRLPAKQLRGA